MTRDCCSNEEEVRIRRRRRRDYILALKRSSEGMPMELAKELLPAS